MPMCYLTWFLANCPILSTRSVYRLEIFSMKNWLIMLTRSHRKGARTGSLQSLGSGRSLFDLFVWLRAQFHEWFSGQYSSDTGQTLIWCPPPMLPMVFIRMLTDSWKLDGEGTDIGKFTVCGLMSSKGSAWQIVPQNVLATNRIPIGT